MQRLRLPSAAKHHGSLEGRGPLRGSVWTGPVGRPLPDEQHRVFSVVQLSLEELVLLVRQLDAQHRAPACGCQVLFHSNLPGSCKTTLSWSGPIQQLGCRFLRGRDSHLGDLEDKLGRSPDFGGRVSLSVVARGSHGERGLRAAGVRVVSVDALPRVPLRIKGEVSGEELNGGTAFASLAHPAASEGQRGRGAAGQQRGTLLRGAVRQGARRAGVDVMLR